MTFFLKLQLYSHIKFFYEFLVRDRGPNTLFTKIDVRHLKNLVFKCKLDLEVEPFSLFSIESEPCSLP